MRLYNLVLILKPSLSEAKRKKLLETIISWLGDLKISKEEEWGQKVLSYPIKRETRGYYVAWELEAKATISSDFERKLLSQEDVIRHLVVRKK